jgi:hypothetical protein
MPDVALGDTIELISAAAAVIFGAIVLAIGRWLRR